MISIYMWCFHIQTHPPHFKYTDQLIKSILSKTDARDLAVAIYVIVCTKDMVDQFNSKYIYDYEHIRVVDLEDIVSKVELRISEPFSKLGKGRKLTRCWGAGGHRDYVAIKRSYSILFLNQLGFSHVWCMDSESLILKKVFLKTIVNANSDKPLLVVGTGNGKSCVKQPQIVKDVLGLDYEPFSDVGVRMNDFWFINTSQFGDMIHDIMNRHDLPIGSFMLGSEMSVYEYFLYSRWLMDKDSVNLVRLDGNLHGNEFIGKAIANREVNISEFTEYLNSNYFRFVQAYRGDYIKKTQRSERGRMILEKLEISIAVSNYTGN